MARWGVRSTAGRQNIKGGPGCAPMPRQYTIFLLIVKWYLLSSLLSARYQSGGGSGSASTAAERRIAGPGEREVLSGEDEAPRGWKGYKGWRAEGRQGAESEEGCWGGSPFREWNELGGGLGG
jgi:hypothetical protein